MTLSSKFFNKKHPQWYKMTNFHDIAENCMYFPTVVHYVEMFGKFHSMTKHNVFSFTYLTLRLAPYLEGNICT